MSLKIHCDPGLCVCDDFIDCIICSFFLSACPVGHFKSGTEGQCTSCPGYSHAADRGESKCACRSGYLRAESDTPDTPCTSKYAYSSACAQSTCKYRGAKQHKHPLVCSHSAPSPVLLHLCPHPLWCCFSYPLVSFSPAPLICFVLLSPTAGHWDACLLWQVVGGRAFSAKSEVGIDGPGWHLHADSGISIQPHFRSVKQKDFWIRHILLKRPQRRKWNNVKLSIVDIFCSLQVWYQHQLEFTSTNFIIADNYNYKGFILIINHVIRSFLLHVLFFCVCWLCGCTSAHHLHFSICMQNCEAAVPSVIQAAPFSTMKIRIFTLPWQPQWF